MPIDNKTLPEYWEEAKLIFEERKKRGEPEFPTGLRFLDDVTDGLGRGEVWIVSGKSGGGKTTLGLQIAKSFADNPKHSIAILSLEMKGWELTTRMFCSISGLNYKQVTRGDYPPDYHKNRKMFEDYISGIDLQIYERGYAFSEIEKIIKADYKTKKPDVIFVDFLQMVEWKSFREERLALSEYIRKLKELANTMNVGIVAISQLRRLPSGTNYQRPPDIIDLKGSGALEQAADKIVFVYGEEKEDQGEIKTRHFIKLAKNRQGELVKEEVLFQGRYYRFEEIDKRYEENRRDWNG